MSLFDRFKKNEKPKPTKTTEGGSDVYEYDEKNCKSSFIAEPTEYMEEIEAHFDKNFPGRKTHVFHEIMSDLIHVDIFVMDPSEDEDFYVLYTAGMSALPMSLPDELLPEYKNLELAELIMFLPKNWNVKGLTDKDVSEDDYWPVRWLKMLARFPHEYTTWFAHGHTIPNGENYEPFADNTKFSCVILVAPGDDELGTLKTKDGNDVNFYFVVPIYQNEAEFKLEKGANDLLEKLFEQSDNPSLIDIKRKSVC